MIMRGCGGSMLGAGFASGQMTHPGNAPRQPVNDPLESYPSHRKVGGVEGGSALRAQREH